MGLADDIIAIRRNLSRIALDHQRRGSGESREDLLDRVAKQEKEAQRIGRRDLIAITLLQRAELLLALGREGEAIPILEKVESALQGLRQDDLRVRALAQLAAAHGRLHNWPSVSAICNDGIALVEKYRYNLSPDYLASAYLRSRIPLYSWGVRSAYELGHHELMIERAELSKCRLILRHTSGPKPASRSADDRIPELRELSRRIGEYPTGEAPDELLAKRRMLWDLNSMEGSSGRPEPFSLSTIQALLQSDQAVLFYYWIDANTLAIVTIDLDDFAMELRHITVEQRQALEIYASHVQKGTTGNFAVFEAVRDFGSFLLPRIAAVPWHEKRSLLICPHRILHSIPFHAMRFGTQWLIERAAVSYIPNLSSLLIAHHPSKTRRVLVVGIERFQVPGRNLGLLPEAELEAQEVKKSYERHGVPAMILLGTKGEATADRVRALNSDGTLGEFSCLHFATHCENVSSDNPMESHFYMQNSLLDGLELANFDVHADTVVLSACCSGQRAIAGRGLTELPGDELFGLQAALFQAGARSVLGTLWPVSSIAAQKIATGFHARLAADELYDAAKGLQASMCDYLVRARIQDRKVYFWAPFFLSVFGKVKTM